MFSNQNTETEDLITQLIDTKDISYELSQHVVSNHGALLHFIPLDNFTQEERLVLYETAIESDGTAVAYILDVDCPLSAANSSNKQSGKISTPYSLYQQKKSQETCLLWRNWEN